MNIAIIGGGIVGLAIGYKLSKIKGNKIHVFEKEKEVGFHQSGRNSGVLHCGLAYKPGSLKAELAVSGQGIQVILEWTPEVVAFDTTAIGQSSSASIDISSVGNGAGTISEVSFSNDIFSLDEANSVLTIEEDSTETLTFIFEPTGAGVFNETVQLHTNDPNNNVIEIDLQGVSVSEVGGEVCDAIWSLDDSPFTLVGDLFVPESCSLTIEPGVTVVLDGYEMVIDGEITCQGTFAQPITAIGGVITINEGAPTLISYLNHESSETTVTTTSGYELVYYNNFESTDKTVEEVNSLALDFKYIKKGDYVINLAAMPIYEKGQVNTLRITKI